jgi:hypothetical protein
MAAESTFLGFTRRQQAVGIGAVGVLLVVVGLSTSSAVGDSYNPLPFGIGVVMVVYAIGVFVHDAVFLD